MKEESFLKLHIMVAIILFCAAICMLSGCESSDASNTAPETTESNLNDETSTILENDASESGNVMMSYSSLMSIDSDTGLIESDDDLSVLGSNYERTKIRTITFLDTLENLSSGAWDVSEEQNGCVMAWVEEADTSGYDLFIAGEGGADANENCDMLFAGYTLLETINFNGNFFTGNVNSMIGMFARCNNLKELDISSFDTSKVLDMQSMFYMCKALNKLEISNLDTSNVTNMRNMFSGIENLTNLDVSNLDTSNVTNMYSMFSNMTALEQLDVSNFITNNVTDMGYMFYECNSLKKLDLGSFNTDNVTDMGRMFQNCYSLVSVNLSSFNTSNVTDMANMFMHCSSLTELDISNFDMANARTGNMFKGTQWE